MPSLSLLLLFYHGYVRPDGCCAECQCCCSSEASDQRSAIKTRGFRTRSFMLMSWFWIWVDFFPPAHRLDLGYSPVQPALSSRGPYMFKIWHPVTLMPPGQVSAASSLSSLGSLAHARRRCPKSRAASAS